MSIFAPLNKSINIISFDIPYPPNYGGVIDVYYKIKHLHDNGIKVHLHCFEYGRKRSPELEKLCEKVYYYPRKTGLPSNFSSLPYTVKSRISAELATNLLSNDYPILFEVLNTCYLLGDDRFRYRYKIYRHSNIEHDYYRYLAQSENKFLNRIYLKTEATKLEKFESILMHADLIWVVSLKDLDHFKKRYGRVKSDYLPSFHSNETVTSAPGKGDYILYHGNLSVSENYEAAQWLIEKIFSKLNYPIKIAGLNPPSFLQETIKGFSNIELIANPTESEMNLLVKNAHVHTLFTAQETGLKLKLLNVLYQGRFVVVNGKMVSGTELKSLDSFLITDSVEEYISFIEKCMNSSFNSSFISSRERLLECFSNKKNIQKFISFLP